MGLVGAIVSGEDALYTGGVVVGEDAVAKRGDGVVVVVKYTGVKCTIDGVGGFGGR